VSLNNISINAKIIFMAIALILSVLVVSWVSISSMDHIGKQIEDIAEQDMPMVEKITQISFAQLEQALLFERAIRYGIDMQEESYELENFNNVIRQFKLLDEKIVREIKEAEVLARRAMEMSNGASLEKEFKRVFDSLVEIEQARVSYSDHANDVFIVLRSADRYHEAIDLGEKFEHEQDALDHSLLRLLEQIEQFTEDSLIIVKEEEHYAIRMLTLVAVISLLMGCVLSLVVTTAIKTGLKDGIAEAVSVAKAISSGDLTQALVVTRKDELGELLSELETMRVMLHGMVSKLTINSMELASASEELSTVSEQTNQGLYQQHSEVEQIATAMSEMTSTVAEVASSATETSQATNDARKETAEGGRSVQQVVDASRNLFSEIEQAAGAIRKLAHQSENIGGVMNVIKGVAEQTNLLALNAAIEAARAGDQGRGFAVVADEVRTLASRTQTSATEIEAMIEGIQSGVGSVVSIMDVSQTMAQENENCANQARESLNIINSSVENINNMNLHVASAAEQQAAVADDINRGITSIKVASDQITSAMSETTASSDELARMAAALQQMAATFKV